MGQIFDCFWDDSSTETGDLGSQIAQAVFDQKWKSDSVSVENDGKLIKGNGICLADSALHQDFCYFEFKIIKWPSDSCSISIGVSQRKKEVLTQEDIGDGQSSWAFQSKISTETFHENDVIGCSFDQGTGRPVVKLSLNGDELPPGNEISGFSGTVFPAVSIADGVEVECNFSMEVGGFVHKPPDGVSGLIPARGLV